MTQDEIVTLATNAFDSETIEASKRLLFELCSTTQRNVLHKGAQKDVNNIKSCLKVLNECGENIPRFVSHYLDDLPPRSSKTGRCGDSSAPVTGGVVRPVAGPTMSVQEEVYGQVAFSSDVTEGAVQERRQGTKVSGSSQPLFFLCELRRFLSDVLPHNHPDAHLLKLDSLQSLPPVMLDLSSSESMLAELINSSAPTIFSFKASSYQFHWGELAMPPGLLNELKQSLEHNLVQMKEVLRNKENGQRKTKRLQKLWELCAFRMVDQASGNSQYCAFLLLKALKTAGREMLLQQRATRAERSPRSREAPCHLKSLTVSFEHYVVGPNMADIKNCHGHCALPITVNTVNHALWLNSHIESGNVHERSPCCVPLEYDSLEMVGFNEKGTFLKSYPDAIAKKCGCR
ncbi:uncharacterized protein LOC144011015 [Festucalex cinctus]